MAKMDNLSSDVVRVKAARFVENGAGTYDFDVFIPAGAIILDITVAGEVLWTAATSASLEVGDYACTITNGVPVIGSAIDADGFFTAVDLKATDLTQGQHINLVQTGGVQGAYLPAIDGGSGATHNLQLSDGVDRIVRFEVVSVGAGTAGRTYVSLAYAMPAVRDIDKNA